MTSAMTEPMVEEAVVHQARWRTDLWVTVRGEQPQRHEATISAILGDEADRLEELVSRFRPDSELSRVNSQAGEWVPVSWAFVAHLTRALDTAADTDGLVDPTLGLWVDHAGYRTWRDGEPAAVRPDRLVRRAWQHVEVRPGSGGALVRIPRGAALDLGSTAKAWLADRVALRVAESTGLPVLANMGGDLRIVGDQPWLVGIDPQLAGVAPQTVLLTDVAMASSGTGRRRWRTGRGWAHHIIDPRTGHPAETPWWTATAVARTAVAANAYSTAAVVLAERAPGWLAQRDVAALLVSREPVGLTAVGGWPPVTGVPALDEGERI